MWYYNEETGNFSVGSIPTKEVMIDEVVTYEEELGWVLIDTRPEPHDNYVFDGSTWVAKAVPIHIPSKITPRQLRLALLAINLLDEVEAMVATDRAMSIWWEYSLEIDRNSEYVVNAIVALGLTELDGDNLFIAGGKL